MKERMVLQILFLHGVGLLPARVEALQVQSPLSMPGYRRCHGLETSTPTLSFHHPSSQQATRCNVRNVDKLLIGSSQHSHRHVTVKPRTALFSTMAVPLATQEENERILSESLCAALLSFKEMLLEDDDEDCDATTLLYRRHLHANLFPDEVSIGVTDLAASQSKEEVDPNLLPEPTLKEKMKIPLAATGLPNMGKFIKMLFFVTAQPVLFQPKLSMALTQDDFSGKMMDVFSQSMHYIYTAATDSFSFILSLIPMHLGTTYSSTMLILLLAVIGVVFGGGIEAGKNLLGGDWRRRIGNGDWLNFEQLMMTNDFDANEMQFADVNGIQFADVNGMQFADENGMQFTDVNGMQFADDNLMQFSSMSAPIPSPQFTSRNPKMDAPSSRMFQTPSTMSNIASSVTNGNNMPSFIPPETFSAMAPPGATSFSAQQPWDSFSPRESNSFSPTQPWVTKQSQASKAPNVPSPLSPSPSLPPPPASTLSTLASTLNANGEDRNQYQYSFPQMNPSVMDSPDHDYWSLPQSRPQQLQAKPSIPQTSLPPPPPSILSELASNVNAGYSNESQSLNSKVLPLSPEIRTRRQRTPSASSPLAPPPAPLPNTLSFLASAASDASSKSSSKSHQNFSQMSSSPTAAFASPPPTRKKSMPISTPFQTTAPLPAPPTLTQFANDSNARETEQRQSPSTGRNGWQNSDDFNFEDVRYDNGSFEDASGEWDEPGQSIFGSAPSNNWPSNQWDDSYRKVSSGAYSDQELSSGRTSSWNARSPAMTQEEPVRDNTFSSNQNFRPAEPKAFAADEWSGKTRPNYNYEPMANNTSDYGTIPFEFKDRNYFSSKDSKRAPSKRNSIFDPNNFPRTNMFSKGDRKKTVSNRDSPSLDAQEPTFFDVPFSESGVIEDVDIVNRIKLELEDILDDKSELENFDRINEISDALTAPPSRPDSHYFQTDIESSSRSGGRTGTRMVRVKKFGGERKSAIDTSRYDHDEDFVDELSWFDQHPDDSVFDDDIYFDRFVGDDDDGNDSMETPSRKIPLYSERRGSSGSRTKRTKQRRERKIYGATRDSRDKIRSPYFDDEPTLFSDRFDLGRNIGDYSNDKSVRVKKPVPDLNSNGVRHDPRWGQQGKSLIENQMKKRPYVQSLLEHDSQGLGTSVTERPFYRPGWGFDGRDRSSVNQPYDSMLERDGKSLFDKGMNQGQYFPPKRGESMVESSRRKQQVKSTSPKDEGFGWRADYEQDYNSVNADRDRVQSLMEAAENEVEEDRTSGKITSEDIKRRRKELAKLIEELEQY